MREIKFRAWYSSVGAMRYFANPIVIMDGRDRYGMFLPVKEGSVFMTSTDDVMQYTGLKDKNGKEIYEGDIIGDSNPDEYYVWGKVAYCDDQKCMYCGKFMVQDKDGYATDWDDADPEGWDKLEVFGNIYENPELLL